MSVTVDEMRVSRSLSTSEMSRKFIIRGTTDEHDAGVAFQSYLDSLGDINFMKLDNSTVKIEEVAANLWYGEASWKYESAVENPPPNSFNISFDISTQTQHITQAVAHISHHGAIDWITRDFSGAIGVDEDGTIQGVDILIPYPTFQINYTFDEGAVNDSYIQTLVDTVGKVNSDTFHNFQAGTLLLTKVSGQKRDDKKWDISFGFSASENATGLTVGGITGIDKKGWEYMWVYYRTKAVDYGSGLTVHHKVPAQVNVEQVYKTANYASNLGI